MGVLDRIWTGQYRLGPDGRRLPLERPARLADFPELKASEWWEVDTRTPLARKLRRYYPWVTPVTGPDGALIDVLLQHRELREAARACQQQARAVHIRRIDRDIFQLRGSVDHFQAQLFHDLVQRNTELRHRNVLLYPIGFQ